MATPEQRFIRELEVFRTEAQARAQFLYGYPAFNSILSEKKKALNAVNQTPLFWNTAAGALQTAFFIVLGRIFDQDSKHNIDRLGALLPSRYRRKRKSAQIRAEFQAEDLSLNTYHRRILCERSMY